MAEDKSERKEHEAQVKTHNEMAMSKGHEPQAKAHDDKRVVEMRKENERLAKEQEAHRQSLRGRPTPTQDEANQAKIGAHPELEADGSTDPFAVTTRQTTAEPATGGYATRQATAKPAV
jgi:hypothetical protein